MIARWSSIFLSLWSWSFLFHPPCIAFIVGFSTNHHRSSPVDSWWRKQPRKNARGCSGHKTTMDEKRILRFVSPNSCSSNSSKACLSISDRREGSSSSQRSNKQRRSATGSRKHRDASSSSKNNNNLQAFIDMNQKLVSASSWEEILSLIQPYVSKASAGHALNQINLTTALHRLARHSMNDKSYRKQILADVRFALLVCCAVEQQNDLSGRNFATMCWSMAKLQLPPPTSAMAIHERSVNSMDVRRQIVQYVKDPKLQHHWIPSLSKLAGQFIDDMGDTILADETFLKGMLQESSNFLWTTASMDRARPDVCGCIVRRNFSPDVGRPQEWSNTVWAFATSLTYQSHDVLLEYLAERMKAHVDFPKAFKSQELSNTIWGVATLLANANEQTKRDITTNESQNALCIVRALLREFVDRRAEAFRTQELANTAWAMATIGFGLGDYKDQGSTKYIVLESDEKESDASLMLDAIRVIVKQSLVLVRKFRSQEINNLSWVLGRMFRYSEHYKGEFKDAVEELFGKMADVLAQPRQRVIGQDIGTTAWGMAALGYKNERAYRKMFSRLSPHQGASYKPQELSNSVWALATVELEIEHRTFFDSLVENQQRKFTSLPEDPFMTVLYLASEELMRRPEQFKVQEIKDTLWGFVTLRVRHPKMFKVVAEHMVGPVSVPYPQQARTFESLSTQSLGNMAWAYARHAQLAEGASTTINGVTGKLANYIAASADIGQFLMRKFFMVFADTALRKHDNLRNLSAQDITSSAWALALLGFKHQPFLEAAIDVFIERSTLVATREVSGSYSFAGQETAILLWAVSMLNVPAGNLLESSCRHLLAQSKSRQPSFFAGPEIGSVVWACSVLNEFPDPLLSNVYDCVFSENSSYRIEEMAATTLIYAQVAICLNSNSKYRYSLPDDFPTGWVESLSKNVIVDEDERVISQHATTSKIQSSVSGFLKAMGFNHQEEYTITMQHLSEQYGLSLPAHPVEVFTLDIAIPEKKIAIEVDGPTHFVTRIDRPLNLEGSGQPDFNVRKDGTKDFIFHWDGSFQEPNGATLLKQRLLTDLGWKIAHIPFWKWTKCTSEEERRAICIDSLNDIGVDVDGL